MKNTKILTLLLLPTIFLSSCSIGGDKEKLDSEITSPEKTKTVILGESPKVVKQAVDLKETIQEEIMFSIESIREQYDYEATMQDMIGSGASGTAYSIFNEYFILDGVFDNLPELEEGFSYYAWIVRDTPTSVLSAGKLEQVNDIFINTFSSEQDLTEYELYFITKEKEETQTPSDHILQGSFLPIRE